jgi:hypothetical protein
MRLQSHDKSTTLVPTFTSRSKTFVDDYNKNTRVRDGYLEAKLAFKERQLTDVERRDKQKMILKVAIKELDRLCKVPAEIKSFLDDLTRLGVLKVSEKETSMLNSLRIDWYVKLCSTWMHHGSVQSSRRPRVKRFKLERAFSPALQEGIKFAKAKLTDLILQSEVQVLEFTAFGNLFITQHSMSPDAFVQMALSWSTAFGTANQPT